MQTATQRIAEFVAGFKLEHAPDEVAEKARVTVLHDVGVAMAGHRLAGPAYEVAKEFGACADGGTRLLVDGTLVTVDQAALATGALMHARTQDDTQLSALTHLGCTTLPALLALGDREDVSGREFLTAMVAGYEAASAIAADHATASTKRGFRATSIYGPFAAAAACVRLQGLSAERTAQALGLAAAFGGGTNQTWVAGTQEWQYQVGTASRNGLVASLLAARGVTGASDALEGQAGHYASFAGTADGAERVGTDLGTRWRITDVTYKPYPICAINQVPVTVMTELVSRHDLKEQDVESVTVALSPAEAAYPGTEEQGPFEDVGGSLMSAPYCLAVAIRKRSVSLGDLRDFKDESLMALVRRVTVVADPSLPGNSCRLTVRTRDGELWEESISTPATFNWDRQETADRLAAIVDDMPFGPDGLNRLATVVDELDRRPLRDLVSATLMTPWRWASPNTDRADTAERS
jgi:2-methylcitrate dehydratase PrpD